MDHSPGAGRRFRIAGLAWRTSGTTMPGARSSAATSPSVDAMDPHTTARGALDIYSTILDSTSSMRERAAAAVTPDINARIAGRVRALRTELGLTLAALAAKCEVSRSMLSLVERGASTPTAVVLEKIAWGLGVSLAALFDHAGAPADPVSRRPARTPSRDPQSGYA